MVNRKRTMQTMQLKTGLNQTACFLPGECIAAAGHQSNKDDLLLQAYTRSFR